MFFTARVSCPPNDCVSMKILLPVSAVLSEETKEEEMVEMVPGTTDGRLTMLAVVTEEYCEFWGFCSDLACDAADGKP
jgi:hypothetical protein